MDNAQLHLRLRESSFYCFRKSFEAVNAGNQDVPHSTVFQLGQDLMPEFGTFSFGSQHAKHFLDSLHGDGDGQVHCLGDEELFPLGELGG